MFYFIVVDNDIIGLFIIALELGKAAEPKTRMKKKSFKRDFTTGEWFD